jgi:copper homeostasis protein
MSTILLEAPVFNVQAAMEAAQQGIDRLELCANFPEGGETPSAGMLRFLKSELDLPIFVMIRPRGGDFVYSSKELLVMKHDIQLLGDLGADGFVFGALDAQGTVNESACEFLLRAAGSNPCTFHRAIDASANLQDSLKKIMQLGFQRVLTSGGKNSLSEGLDQVLELLRLAQDQLIVMPGGGLKPVHVPILKESGYLKEIHASCKLAKPSANQFINPELSFSSTPLDYSTIFGIDPVVVEEFKSVL